jgi:hypothetical protein
VKIAFDVIEGKRDELERRALEAIFTDRDHLPELLRRLEPAATGKLRVISAEQSPEPERAPAVPAP